MVKRVFSPGEETLAAHLTAYKIPFEREYKFHPLRKWRFDFCFPEHKIAVEVEGGSYTGGRHQTTIGFEKDLIKYNAAARLGWLVFRYTTRLVKTGVAVAEIGEILRETAVTP